MTRGRVRYYGRRAYTHARTLARDPEVRDAAKSVAILGGMYVGLRAMPNLRTKAAKLWRARTRIGSPGRHVFMNMLHSSRMVKHGAVFGAKHPTVARAQRIAKRVEALAKRGNHDYTTQTMKRALRAGTFTLL